MQIYICFIVKNKIENHKCITNGVKIQNLFRDYVAFILFEISEFKYNN